jgi:hypothetical protein
VDLYKGVVLWQIVLRQHSAKSEAYMYCGKKVLVLNYEIPHSFDLN